MGVKEVILGNILNCLQQNYERRARSCDDMLMFHIFVKHSKLCIYPTPAILAISNRMSREDLDFSWLPNALHYCTAPGPKIKTNKKVQNKNEVICHCILLIGSAGLGSTH